MRPWPLAIIATHLAGRDSAWTRRLSYLRPRATPNFVTDPVPRTASGWYRQLGAHLAQAFRHAWVDATQAPLYVLRLPNEPTVEQTTAFCAAMEHFLAFSDERFGWVTDLAQLHSVGAVQRRVFMHANQRSRKHLERRLVAMGVSAPRPFQRGLVTVFHWFVPAEFPLQVFADLPEAMAWVVEQMGQT